MIPALVFLVALFPGAVPGVAQVADDGNGAHTVRREFGLRVKMRDGTVLIADAYRPDIPGRVPIILVRTPYTRTGLGSYRAGHYWASHGYGFVVQDVRGRGDSDGSFEPLVHEARDGYDTQTWAGSLPWASGKVGTFGGSYLGWTQVFPAPLNNPALAAMIPMVTPSDPGGFWPMRRGGISFGMLEWAMVVMGRTNRGFPDGEPEFMPAYRTPPLDSVDIRMGQRSPVWQRYLANLHNPLYWRSRSYQPDLPKSRAPMLHVTGWYDGTLGGSLENFAAMRSRAAPDVRANQYLLVGPWRHWVDEDARSTVIGGMDFGSDSKVATHRVYRAWFDRFLGNRVNALDGWRRVRLFVLGDNRWLGADDWPIPGTRFVPHYVHGARAGEPGRGTLTADSSATGSDRYDYDPRDPTPFLWSRNVDSGGPEDYGPIEARPDALVYTMASPPRRLVVCGPVRASVVASSSALDTDWVARLSLVHENGYSQRLTEGWVRARARKGEFRNDPLTPGKSERYDIDLWGTCVAVSPGQRLRLSIMSGAFPLLTPNLNTGGSLATERSPVVARQTVYHESARRSYVTLPIVDAPDWIPVP